MSTEADSTEAASSEAASSEELSSETSNHLTVGAVWDGDEVEYALTMADCEHNAPPYRQ